MSFGLHQLKRLRDWRGLTQQDLSEKSGVKLITIQKHEQGATGDALLSVADPLAQALAVQVEALYSVVITDKLVKASK